MECGEPKVTFEQVEAVVRLAADHEWVEASAWYGDARLFSGGGAKPRAESVAWPCTSARPATEGAAWLLLN